MRAFDWAVRKFTSSASKEPLKQKRYFLRLCLAAGAGIAAVQSFTLQDPWPGLPLSVLPTRFISRIWGAVNSIPLPEAARSPVYQAWTDVFGCNLAEMAAPSLKSFNNLGEFFTRELKPGARPITAGADLVYPCDGKIMHYGEVSADGKVEQVKGMEYELAAFLGEKVAATNSESKLFYCVLYLAPGDYHRFHAPCAWTVHQRLHFPGDLLSVCSTSVNWIKNLFVLNERVVLSGTWKHGFFSYIAVGATNVGSIRIHCDQELSTNQTLRTVPTTKHYTSALTLEPGQEVGVFQLGSTIVLVFEAPDFEFSQAVRSTIKMGQIMGSVPVSKSSTKKMDKVQESAPVSKVDVTNEAG